MKIRRIDPKAVTSNEPSAKLVSLTEDELQGVSGAGCWFSLEDADGNHVGDAYHPSYEEGDGGMMA